MNISIEESWKELLKEEFEKPYFQDLIAFVKEEYKTRTVFPPGRLIFNAFSQCPLPETEVVLLGQDPYHGPGQANGLAFSVNDGITPPPSLRNIFKEVAAQTGAPKPASGNLERWARQGVLLLNATLTVRAGTPGSHQGKGWEQFTDAVIRKISEEKENVVFVLWGAYAQKKGSLIDTNKHLILKSAHPSPFAADRGFFGNGHFVKANEYLKQQGKKEIVW